MEILNIIFLISIFIIFFSVNLPLQILKFDSNDNYLDKIIFNTLVQINLILLLSFLNVTLKTILIIYFIYLTTCVIFQFINQINIKSLIKKDNLYYFFIITICLFLCLDVSYSLILDWDAQVFWISKTLNFYNNENIGNLVNSRNENYPFLGSLLWATFWKISFISEEYTGRLFYVFLYSVSLASLIETLKSTPVIKSIFFIILVLMSYKYVHFSGSQDVLIFCLIAIAAKNLYCIIDEEGNLTIKQLVLLLLICNSLIWTKQEGTVYAFIIMFTVLFYSKSILYKKIFLFGFIGFLFALRIFIHKTYNLDISINTNVWSDFSLNSITDKMSFDRMLLITKFFIYSFFKNLLFMMGLVFFIISLFSKVINKKDLYIYFFYIMSYGFIFIAYIATDADLAWMLKVGMDRLIYSASPLYILIIIKYINAQTIKI